MLGQETIQVEGMTFAYRIEDDVLRCELRAPTNGWTGVGFNSKNSIVGSDLLLFNVVDGKATSKDLYVKSLGNPMRDEDLGGKYSIELLDALEDEKSTVVRFVIPLNSGDPYDYAHELDKDFWLILAYSVEDDFEHHSRVRKHIPLQLKHRE